MKLKSLAFGLSIVLIFLFVFSACGNNQVSQESSGRADMPAEGNGIINNDDSYSDSAEAPAASAGEESSPAERKIIQDASLEMEAEDASVLYDKLSEYGRELGGYDFSFDVQHYETYSVVNAVIKIPPEKLRMFMSYAGENATIINSKMSSEDVTESYYDIQTRLETKRKSLERYYALLDSAKSVDEIIQLQRTIDGITEEIESYEGKLKMWDSLVDMATVKLYIRQVNDPVKIQKDIDWNALSFADMGYLIKNGFINITGTVVSVLQWIAIVLIAGSPVWIIAGLVLWLCLRAAKKRKKKQMEQLEAMRRAMNQPTPPMPQQPPQDKE